ncbi:hypothetical protein LXL04_008371 [Taraxacum kok-saghyz]
MSGNICIEIMKTNSNTIDFNKDFADHIYYNTNTDDLDNDGDYDDYDDVNDDDEIVSLNSKILKFLVFWMDSTGRFIKTPRGGDLIPRIRWGWGWGWGQGQELRNGDRDDTPRFISMPTQRHFNSSTHIYPFTLIITFIVNTTYPSKIDLSCLDCKVSSVSGQRRPTCDTLPLANLVEWVKPAAKCNGQRTPMVKFDFFRLFSLYLFELTGMCWRKVVNRNKTARTAPNRIKPHNAV